MQIGNIAIDYLGHVCFRFASKQGGILITDPFFAEGFHWNGHFEKYLTPPRVGIDEITECDAIFISHIHGDHFDPEAICTIHGQCGCSIIAPRDVLDELRKKGIRDSFLVTAEEDCLITIADMDIRTYCGYDLEYTAEDGSQNKYAITIECESSRLFYSGDCHRLPPAVKGIRFDAMFCWAEPNDDTLVSLCTGLDTKCFVLMHGDKFEPGYFICNCDYPKEKRRIERLVPWMEVIIPDRSTGLTKIGNRQQHMHQDCI